MVSRCSVVVGVRQPVAGSTDRRGRLGARPLLLVGVSGSGQAGGQRRAEQVRNAGRRQPTCGGGVRGRRWRPGAEQTGQVAEPGRRHRVVGGGGGGRLDAAVSTAGGGGRRLTQAGVDERQRRADGVLAAMQSRRARPGGGVQFLLATPLRPPVLKPDLHKDVGLS